MSLIHKIAFVIDNHFNKSHKLHNIFNGNNLKVRYRLTPNKKTQSKNIETERSWINSTKLNQKFQNRVIKGLRSSSSGEWATNNVIYDVTYQYNWHRWLERCASSDWSRIASYLALIASHEMIIAGTGCLAFWLCFHESDKRGKRKLNCEEHKNASEYGGIFFQKRDINYLLI